LNKDVVFQVGQYSPETSTGKRLLAHELTHVAQQSGEVLHKLTIGRSGDACEGKAHHVAADAVMQTPEIHCQFVNVQKR